jgi:hypothetical protein
MKRYLIERHIPGVGGLTPAQYKDLAATSNRAVAKLAGAVQWVQSYIAADNTFCIYLAESEQQVREHSRIAGFPITRINETITVIDPLTAYS